MRSSTAPRPISGAEEKLAMEATERRFSRPRVPRRIGFASSCHSHNPVTERMRFGYFISMMEPRVMLLAVFTAFFVLTIAPGELGPLRASVAVITIAAGAGAAGVLNMWYDADIDAIMARTA